MNRLLFLFLVACGGTVSPGNDAGETLDASPDVVVVHGGDGATDATSDGSTSSQCPWTGPSCNDPGAGCCFDGGFFECDDSDAGYTWQPYDAGAWSCQ